jgi:hypothetical protein
MKNHDCVLQIKLVLKEDVAGLYETSWELFVQGSSARKTHKSVAISFPSFPETYFS